MVSPDSQAIACPLSGRNSTYRPVQISGAGSADPRRAHLIMRAVPSAGENSITVIGDHHAPPIVTFDDNGRHCAAGGAIISMSITRTSAQAPAASVAAPASALKTPWGEPDLQGIWTAEFDTPLQRLAKYADQEFFTEAQRAELDKERAATLDDREPRLMSPALTTR
jgi:hypothetical protein